MTVQGIILNTTFSVVLISIIVWFLREWISARLKAAIQHEHEQKLETYKAQLKTESEKSILEFQSEVKQKFALHEAARSSFAEGQKSSMERKLDSIDELWASILKLRNTLSSAIVGIDLFRTNEVEEYKEMKSRAPLLSQWTPEELKKKIESIEITEIEKVRPYIGEYLWAIFSSYQVIHIRLLVHLYLSQDDAEKLKWHTDEGTYLLIKAVLTESELSEFNRMNFGRFFWLRRKLESKILYETQKIISGEHYGAESFEKAATILQLLQPQDSSNKEF